MRDACMVVYLRIITIFSSILFSLTASPSLLEDKNYLKLPSIDWKNDSLGDLGKFSPDLLDRFLVSDLDSSKKNIIRKTSKIFSRLLSLENAQNFIFQKNLNASKKDLSDLIVRTLNAHRDNIPAFKLDFIEGVSARLGKDLAAKEDVAAQYCNEIIGLSESLKWNLIRRENNYFNCFSMNDNNIASHSLIVACITRDTVMLEQYLEKLSAHDNSLSKHIRRILHIIIQNNDINSLMLIANTKKMSTAEKREAINCIICEMVQLAAFCKSDKVIKPIMSWYKTAKHIHKTYNQKPLREENVLATWLDVPDTVQDKNVYSIIAEYYPLLFDKYKSNPKEFYEFIAVIFSDNKFLKCIPGNNSSKPHRIKNCLII